MGLVAGIHFAWDMLEGERSPRCGAVSWHKGREKQSQEAHNPEPYPLPNIIIPPKKTPILNQENKGKTPQTHSIPKPP